MATLNDFKIVSQRALAASKRLELKAELDEFTRQQIGFYLLVLECITGEKDVDDLVGMIIDDKFCKDYWGKGNDDLGVDAVYIDEINKKIQLFNFKYRENYKENDSTKEADVYDASRFLSAVTEEEFKGLAPRTKVKVKDVISKLQSTEIYEIELFMIANVNHDFSISPAIKIYEKSLGLKVKNITLDAIAAFLSDSPQPKTAKLLVDSESVLSYGKGDYSTSKSFLVKISLAELIRITCTDDEMRLNYQLTDFSKLVDCELEMSLLFENVRGYLGDTRFNKNIIRTIEDDPACFFLYNNGLTFAAKVVEAESANAKKKVILTINGFQIVNGGQTLRSIFEFCKGSFDEEKLAEAEVLVRIFKAENDDLKNHIAEYTNSQNSIASSDLKSVSTIQRQIESYLATKRILYVRKAGDTGKNIDFDDSISMEKTAQILYSFKGYPERVANNKKKLFEQYYDDIFNDSLELERVEEIIRLYLRIKKLYKESEYQEYEQKYMYVIYMISKKKLSGKNHDVAIKNAIKKLEGVLKNFETDLEIADSRKILKPTFKQAIDN